MRFRQGSKCLLLFLFSLLLSFCSVSTKAQSAPTTISPIAAGVAAGCDNSSIQCTYTDTAPVPGPHFYFVVAFNSNGYSVVSNSSNVTATSGHNVVVTWIPSTTSSPTVSYYIWRGAPASGLTGHLN